MGNAAARGAYRGVELHAAPPRLLQHLTCRQHVAEPADRGMLDAQMNDVRYAAGVRQGSCEFVQRCIRCCLVLSDREGMWCRPEQAIEQHVAGTAVEVVSLRDAIFQLHVDVHPQPACAGRRGGG